MEEHKDILTALEITSNKKLISSSADKSICVWDLNKYKLINEKDTDSHSGVLPLPFRISAGQADGG